jgi:hypothetical protein
MAAGMSASRAGGRSKSAAATARRVNRFAHAEWSDRIIPVARDDAALSPDITESHPKAILSLNRNGGE